ncbi:hypothetical protein Lal_00019653 [Lupinus albus]|nr:hypothetical protein Lal_00019653 [Lupinus albus]
MQFQVQLVNQKNRRHSIIKHSKLDIAQLLHIGSLQHALPRGEFDNSVQDLPINVAVAVANLAYTASRCGELSLLHQIRNLFRERYGMEFDFTNVELSAGNLVDFQLRKNLSINIVPEDEILKLFSEIAQDLNFPLGFKDLKQIFNSQFHTHYHGDSDQKPEVVNDEMYKTCSDNDEAWMQPPRAVTYREIWSTSPMSYEVESRRSNGSKDTSPMKAILDYKMQHNEFNI